MRERWRVTDRPAGEMRLSSPLRGAGGGGGSGSSTHWQCEGMTQNPHPWSLPSRGRDTQESITPDQLSNRRYRSNPHRHQHVERAGFAVVLDQRGRAGVVEHEDRAVAADLADDVEQI